MSYLPSIIPAGQISLRGYQENNIFRHAQGIESYHQLVNYNFLEANRGVVWELPIDFELMSIWVKTVTPATTTDKIDLSVSSFIAGDNFTSLISFNLQARQVDSSNVWATWIPPLTILPKGLTVKMESNVATEIIYLAGRECYLSPAIYPSMIEPL
ncbi:MAG: hypothetical protein EWV41_19750 [Microcystis wesenbergii Mw_MB_S_20031200_S109]|uniref:Uncharacterized protein n=1 Tax=Microcystis wesenbergii Mw_MB_S_20031200_S109D TaxID=2486241 RepID=A0A552M9S1_9CHRO|nr:MAG: hypothetical protein EWV41_19750 [Microcystis wesenbergii Mw_MB_S_20031200_S109]TRV29210.1 MAG: hypothetical protein EWV88_01720 [Microcystis wesenbergii Mw_MB_S_20031200_S109D]